MAKEKIIIEVDGYDVESRIALGKHDGHPCVWIESICDGRVQPNFFGVRPSTKHSIEQYEYDLDQARHQHAAEIAGEVHLRKLSDGMIEEVSGELERVKGPTVPRPNSTAI